jgi:hypothetical protein
VALWPWRGCDPGGRGGPGATGPTSRPHDRSRRGCLCLVGTGVAALLAGAERESDAAAAARRPFPLAHPPVGGRRRKERKEKKKGNATVRAPARRLLRVGARLGDRTSNHSDPSTHRRPGRDHPTKNLSLRACLILPIASIQSTRSQSRGRPVPLRALPQSVFVSCYSKRRAGCYCSMLTRAGGDRRRGRMVVAGASNRTNIPKPSASSGSPSYLAFDIGAPAARSPCVPVLNRPSNAGRSPSAPERRQRRQQVKRSGHQRSDTAKSTSFPSIYILYLESPLAGTHTVHVPLPIDRTPNTVHHINRAQDTNKNENLMDPAPNGEKVTRPRSCLSLFLCSCKQYAS